MKKSQLTFVVIFFMLSLIMACSKDKDSGLDENPPVNNPNPNPNPNDTTPAPDPVFTDYFPASAMIGDTITLTGQNFDTNVDKLKVGFGVVEATVVSASKTMIKAIVPDDIENAKVKIRLISGGKFVTIDRLFNLKAPVIESISHTSGFEGQSITIRGKGFRNSYKFDQVTIGDKLIKGSSTTPRTDTLIIHTPKMPAGKYPITVTVAGLVATATEQFTVIVPVIKSFTPDAGSFAKTITITGENFKDPNGGNTGVIFTDWETGRKSYFPYVISLSNNEIKASIPEMMEGKYKVAVHVLGSYVDAVDPFTYKEP